MSNPQSYQGIPGSYRRNVIFKSVLVFVAGLILTTAILYLAVRQPIGPSYGEGFRMLAQLQDDIFYKAAIIYAITTFLIVCGIIFLTLMYSHRIAGPVFRLSMFVKVLCSGDFSSKVHIRQKDVIHPLAGEMNTMVEQYRQTLNSIQEEIKALDQYAEQLDEGQGDDEALWKDIEKSAGRIEEGMERYRL